MTLLIEFLEPRNVRAATGFPVTVPEVLGEDKLRDFVGAFEVIGGVPNSYVYQDTEHHPTIGYGSNIDGVQGRNKIKAVFETSVSYDNLVAGVDDAGDPYGLSTAQIQRLFTYDLVGAFNKAKSQFHELDTYSLCQQIALIDFCFNVKNPTAFHEFTSAVIAKEWYLAGTELIDSDRYSQAPGLRVRTDAEVTFLQATTYEGRIDGTAILIDLPDPIRPISGIHYQFTEIAHLEGQRAINSIESGSIDYNFEETPARRNLTIADDREFPGFIQATDGESLVLTIYQRREELPDGFSTAAITLEDALPTGYGGMQASGTLFPNFSNQERAGAAAVTYENLSFATENQDFFTARELEINGITQANSGTFIQLRAENR